MKTNISNLMNLVAECDKNANMLWHFLFENMYTVTIKELDGRETIVEDRKESYDSEFAEYIELNEKTAKMKKIIYQKNNELKLPDGMSIQDALVEVATLRKKQGLLNQMINYKDSTRRITEVNNSYFECKKLNFDMKKIKEELNAISERIQTIEFEISKLNSLEFEIEL